MLKYITVLLVSSLWPATCVADDKLNTRLLTDPHPPRLSDELIQKTLRLTPGTKWCGERKSTKDDNELGEAEEADICCRNQYLHCDVIENKSEKFGLKNNNPYSVSTCFCNEELLKCLSRLPNDEVANRVRWRFFGVQHPECIILKNGKAEYAESPIRDPDLARRIDSGEIKMPEI